MTKRLLFCFFSMTVLVAACGSKAATTTTSAAQTPSSAATTTSTSRAAATSSSAAASAAASMDLEWADFTFKPASLNVKPGQKVTLNISNTGAVHHNIQITSLNIDKTLEAGEKGTVDITVPANASGSIDFVCKFHVARAMVGKLQVTP